MATVVVNQSQRSKNPGCLVQVLWFALVGWWASQIWIAVAWFLIATILGMPLGVMMLDRLPKIIALRDPSQARGNGVSVVVANGVTVVTTGAWQPQRNLLVRAIYFVLIGWWLSAVWMELAWAVCLTIIGLPLGFWMFDRVPALVSLRR
jgi:uncharacterized membrane protein YccF (DUF307 family)